MVLHLSEDMCWLLEQKYLLHAGIAPDTPSKRNSLRVATCLSPVMKKLEVANGRSVTGVNAIYSEGC